MYLKYTPDTYPGEAEVLNDGKQFTYKPNSWVNYSEANTIQPSILSLDTTIILSSYRNATKV